MRPLIVAEMSASHNGSLDEALRIVDTAEQCGADCVKVQTWSQMTVSDYIIQQGAWAGRRLHELYDECRLPWDWHEAIFKRCKELGLIGFSTPFDRESVDFLETLDCPLYKIASAEITDLELIRHAASTGKPIIISTGMATEEEIVAAVEVASISGAKGITLLRCVSAYPAATKDFNLATMLDMADRFGCDVGLSDHSRGVVVAVTAAAMGASVIEKHLAMNPRGIDGSYACAPPVFERMVREIREAVDAQGVISYGPTESEKPTLIFRRALWTTTDIAAGAEITEDNTRPLRPDLGGISARDYQQVIGMKTKTALPRGTQLAWDMIGE